MKKRDFSSNQLSRNLTERVKELECLYKISRIASENMHNINKALSLIVAEIPNGWQYPDLLEAYLKYGDNEYGTKPKNENYQSSTFYINKKLSGYIVVSYKGQFEKLKLPIFLKEEQALLNQIGFELSSLIQLDIKRQQEALLEEQLRYNDRLNLLGEITAGIAHELNTPLGNILGYSELLMKRENNSEKRRDLEKVLKSTKHAREIVKKLMFFSCEIPTQYEKVSINELVQESIDLLKIQLLEKGIKICLNLADNLPDLKLDPVQFTQVIFNIVLNAIDAMDKNGLMTIRTVKVGKDVRLEISDNGIGISNEDIKKLFQPFYSTKKSPGTGLGLAVTHGIVQSNGGRIDVDSTLGKGTTFSVTLKTDKYE